MVCRKQEWHSYSDCEDSETVEAREFKKLKSDLFRPRGSVPAAQNEIMVRNASVSPFLRLPPEIRLQIYGFVFGGHQLWIDCTPSRVDFNRGDVPEHSAGHFYNVNVNGSGKTQRFDLRLLYVCRQIFTETSLLPYALNKFFFSTDEVRRAFGRAARPGKKLVQKRAIGDYEIMGLSDLEWCAVDTSVPGWYGKIRLNVARVVRYFELIWS